MSTMKLRNQDSGLVSIIVAIAFIVFISLVTTSFALLSRRESRQSLDRQLSTQAFYAAEAGVNDAVKAVKAGTTNINSCDGASTLNSAGPNLGDNLSYTCVLVDESPGSLQFGPVETDGSKVVRVQAPSNIGKIRISWQDFNGKNTFAPSGLPFLPQQSYNATTPSSYANNTGILRSVVIPVTGSMNRNDLVNNSQTLFMYPNSSTTVGQVGNYAYTPGQASQGAFVDGQCNTANINSTPGLPQYCNVDVTGLAAANTNVFYIRMKSIYRTSKVTIQAFANDTATDPLELTNDQVVIDSTGKANDVLRRIQVRIPVNTEYDTPEFALESADDICKKTLVTSFLIVDGCEPYN